jgi:DNA-binding phage protein
MKNIGKKEENEQWKLLVLMLKEIAKSKGITQDQIAEKSGLIQSNISRFFSLKYTPNLDTFLEVAKAIEVNFFFEDKDSKTDLTIVFEKAMQQLGRRKDPLLKN